MSKATATEKRYMAKVAALGCLIHDDTPAEIHHPRVFAGGGQRCSHFLVIPLCYECHRGRFSIHHAKREFENVNGTELDLLAETIRRLNG